MVAKTIDLALDDQRRAWFDQACSKIDLERLKQLTFQLTDIHSPTGNERRASEFLTGYFKDAGFEAWYQAVTERSGNCVGTLKGSGEGPHLMLYAPIDTHLDAEEEKDIPWVGPALRADMIPTAEIRGDTVIGLGASNPKSMLTTLVEAAHCIHEAGIPLLGDLSVATAGGGMPWKVAERDNAGVSTGVRHLLESDFSPDMGLIFKPWDEVYYENPGMYWFKITTWGTMGYSGIPRGVPGFDSSIIPATKVITELEEWLIAYPDKHMSAQLKPEGWVAAVRSGWPDKPSFPAAACEIYLDVRTTPDQTTADIQTEFDQVMQGILKKYPEIKADWELYMECPSSRTDPNHWIVQSAVRAWEDIHGKPYPGATPMSGQTDAATIANMGIPLVRTGYPFIGDKDMPDEFAEGLGGMGVAVIPDLLDPVKQLIYIAIDSCTRNMKDIAI